VHLDDRPASELERVADRIAVVRPGAGVDDEAVGGLPQLLAPVDVLALAVRLAAENVAAELAAPFADLLFEVAEGESTVDSGIPSLEQVEVHAIEDADQHSESLDRQVTTCYLLWKAAQGATSELK
jgi:hypothetical protein